MSDRNIKLLLLRYLLQAATLKTSYRLSVADALIAAVAKLHHATLVHKDPEFEAIASQVEKRG